MRAISFLVLVLALCASALLPLACGKSGAADSTALPTTNHIEQFGINWSFDTAVPYGQFANGDYWVIGPVTITSVSPDFDGEHHGLEINPADPVLQGFDVRIADFDPERIPALPYLANPGESIVKTVSVEPFDEVDCRPCLQTAAVLTVVGEPPTDLGATVFRPPYFGSAKPLYSTTNLRVELLPSLPHTPHAQTLDVTVSRFERVHLDHKNGWTGAMIHPVENMAEYGSSVSTENSNAALSLMLDDPLEAKTQALVDYVQYGIDLYHMLKGGQTWPANGGHGEGRKLPLAFAAVFLDNQEMKDALLAAGEAAFAENGGMYESTEADMVLWGQLTGSEDQYWTNVVFDTGARTLRDPYRMIDGGYRPGQSYQFCCTAMPYKAVATAALLVPEITQLWNCDAFFEYVERWVARGTWTQPDPCAPPRGTCTGGDNADAVCTTATEPTVCTGENAFCDASANWDHDYGVVFGPDGAGGCISDTDTSDGIGRFPLSHGTASDGGHYSSPFADELWDAHIAPTL